MNIGDQNLSEGMVQLLLVVGASMLIVWACYAHTIQGLLKKIAPENRFMEPQQVWLVLIPLFNIYWNFVIAARVSNSLTNEFFDRKIAEEEDPGRHAGVRYAVLFLLSYIPQLPGIISLTFFLLTMVYFVTYWVKLNNFKLLLEDHNRFRENTTNKGNNDTTG